MEGPTRLTASEGHSYGLSKTEHFGLVAVFFGDAVMRLFGGVAAAAGMWMLAVLAVGRSGSIWLVGILGEADQGVWFVLLASAFQILIGAMLWLPAEWWHERPSARRVGVAILMVYGLFGLARLGESGSGVALAGVAGMVAIKLATIGWAYPKLDRLERQARGE